MGGLAGGVTGWTTFRESQKSKALIDFARVATRVREHRHLVVLACHVPLREALVVVVDVLRLRPGAHDGRVVDGRDDDFVDVFLRERLGCREVARDVLRGSGGREGARQPEEDDAAALAALREVHRPARKKNASRAEQRGTLSDAVDAVDAKHNSKELHQTQRLHLGPGKLTSRSTAGA